MRQTVSLYLGFLFTVASLPALYLGAELAARFDTIHLFALPSLLCFLIAGAFMSYGERG